MSSKEELASVTLSPNWKFFTKHKLKLFPSPDIAHITVYSHIVKKILYQLG